MRSQTLRPSQLEAVSYKQGDVFQHIKTLRVFLECIIPFFVCVSPLTKVTSKLTLSRKPPVINPSTLPYAPVLGCGFW